MQVDMRGVKGGALFLSSPGCIEKEAPAPSPPPGPSFQALTVRLSPLGRAIHPSLGQQSPTRQSNRNMSCPSPWDQLQSGCLNFEHFKQKLAEHLVGMMKKEL